jgi:HAMP domain-containing protein
MTTPDRAAPLADRKPPRPGNRQPRPRRPRHAGGLARKLLIPIAAVSFVLLGVFTYVTWERRERAALEEAHQVAQAIERQVVADRRYYTQHIVPAAKAGNLTVTNRWREAHGPAIPLPTTFVREVAEQLNSTATETEYKLAMLSLFPVNPKQGPRTLVEREMMKANFRDGEQRTHWERVGDRSFLTLYVPDFANAESCVTCHNALPESPKRNWALGEVMGSLAVTIPLDDRLRRAKAGAVQEVGAFAGILLVSCGLLYFQAQRSILNPIRSLATAATELSAGNLAAQVQVRSDDDEVGQLAESFSEMTATVRRVVDREVAGRQALDHTVTGYVQFLEAVAQGDLTRRLPEPPQRAADAAHLARLGEGINRTVDRLGELAAHLAVAGDKLGKELDDQERAALARRLRDAVAGLRL